MAYLQELGMKGLLFKGGAYLTFWPRGVEAYMGEGTYCSIDTYSRKYGTGKKVY